MYLMQVLILLILSYLHSTYKVTYKLHSQFF
uniref:Uncharacterized protein n=1 Tax=Siphoviridae sp. ctg6Y13 TaxID=2826419 RepID=A0A8S5QYB2_9CAUD|nr:MAG TPA: hypothetical protein [Siphoviridae sp. ctg6Y13]DAE94914.1 MAG TPA: hypothetical protein [Caudoviricetes sp.]DAF30420.1 MAG TPA: hypothetical protein [Caudoviricetes sp.]DAS75957.1 MAG TPA: hypothetical protein [Bacteriophage sp.]